ncbi:MAG: tripartite tricarboxylate transporter TctB family protein [Rhodospirillales bacterium]
MSKPAAEVFACLMTIMLSGMMIYEASMLPPGSFDPLGSGSVPLVTSYILIFLALAVLIRGVVARRNEEGDGYVGQRETASGLTMVRVGGFVSLTVLYVALSNLKVLHFLPMSIGFLFAALLLLNGVCRRSVLVSGVVSILIPAALFFCFTKFFTVDLPGAF